jgi:hypothetical protein
VMVPGAGSLCSVPEAQHTAVKTHTRNNAQAERI